jgi:ADP-ribose pyrophosphatase YjhB (NUDIX family)
MPSVHAHGVIWVGDRLVVHRHTVRGLERITLPGGRVRERESVTDALVREVQEELDRDVEVGELVLAAEVLDQGSRQAVVLVFEARLPSAAAAEDLDLIDPRGPEADAVLPPVLGELARLREGSRLAQGPRWLGNLHTAEHMRT